MYVQRTAVTPITNTRYLLEILIEHHTECCTSSTCDRPDKSIYANHEVRVKLSTPYKELLLAIRDELVQLRELLPPGAAEINRSFVRKGSGPPLGEVHALQTDQPTLL